MNLILILVVISFAVVSHAAHPSLADEHASDVITYLWWALGIMGSIAATISSGTGVWILLRVLKHEKEIAVIKARCEYHDEEDGSDD